MKVLRGNRAYQLQENLQMRWYNVQISFLSVIKHKNIFILYLNLSLFNLLYDSLAFYLWKKNLNRIFLLQKRVV